MYKKDLEKREIQVKKNDGKQAMMGMRAHQFWYLQILRHKTPKSCEIKGNYINQYFGELFSLLRLICKTTKKKTENVNFQVNN